MSTKPTEVLFTPYTLGDLQLTNRIVMAPLTRTRVENQGKVPNELMTEYYAQRAGAGLIITEGTFVSEQGQGETPREMSVEDVKQSVKDFRHAAQVARDADGRCYSARRRWG
jgi:2,4-dienoyl-CoA reductase-like NADH-dependent reductase (Old Yellow Enzyme family)